jgi:hypothetical protein
MKKLFGIFILGIGLTAMSCNNDKRTSEQVLDVDTTGVQYDVDKTIREKTVDVDTTHKSETIENDSVQ